MSINQTLSTHSFDAYIQSIMRTPILSEQEEQHLLYEWLNKQSLNAAKQLVLSHLKLVYSICKQYVGYGLPQPDLMQEGSLGLMSAVKKFNPSFKVRLATYASYWIKAYIHAYILKNWRLVKVASTSAQKKLFFKLRSLLPEQGQATQSQLQSIATQLKVSMQDVKYMQQRMLEYDSSLDISDGEHALIDYLPAPSSTEPLKQLLQQADLKVTNIDLPNTLQTMALQKPRLFSIVKQRWLCAPEDKVTMKDLSIQLGVSIERVNQLEKQAMQWLKQQLQANNCLNYDAP